MKKIFKKTSPSEEVVRLTTERDSARTLAAELIPYVRDYIAYGLQLGEKPEGHDEDDCFDCLWYELACKWQARFDSGEIDAIINGTKPN